MLPDLPPTWLHPRDITEARAAQAEMAARIIEQDDLPAAPRLIGGADVSTTRFDPTRRVHAALVTLERADDRLVAEAGHSQRAAFPYIPGYLGFREAPALHACWQRLARRPEILLVDGQGRAHPRGLGIACQLGLLLGLPSIGVAKSLLVGAPARDPGSLPGDAEPILWQGRVIGMALRSRAKANPLYISVGHRVSLATAVALVLDLTRGRRLPAPIRAAHDAANRQRRAAESAPPPCDAPVST